MNPGRLRQRVTIQQGSRANALGGPTTTWSDQETVWAQVAQVSASGAARYAQAGYTNVTHEVTIRGPKALTLALTRFTWGDRTLTPVAPPRDASNMGALITIAVREETDEVL